MQYFAKIKEQVISEINIRSMNDNRIYNFVLQLVDYNIDIADAFMTSAAGGYSEGELNEIKRSKFRIKRIIDCDNKSNNTYLVCHSP